VNGAAYASFIPRLPEIRTRLGLSLDALGFTMTAAIAIGTAGGLLSPRVIDRFGTRRSLVVFATVLVAGLPLVGVATVPLVFVLGVAMMSVSDGIVDVAMNLQGSWLSARRHAPVMNRLHGLWSLGTVIGGLLAAQAAALGVSLEAHLLGVAVVLAAAVAFVGKGLLASDEGSDDHATSIAPDAPRRTRALWVTLIVLALSGAFAITIELVSSDWAAFRLSEDFGASAGFAGLGFVAFTVGMTLGRLVGDSVQIRLGADRLIRIAILVAGLGLASAAFAPSRWVVLAGYLVAGAGISTFFPRLYDDAAKFKGRRGAGLAWLRTGSSITALAIPTVVGVLSASRLSVGAATGIVTLPCILGFFVITRRRVAVRSA
jgi:MFS family permease